MPPKVEKKTVTPTAPKSGPIVSKAKKDQQKEKPKQIRHDYKNCIYIFTHKNIES